MVLLSCSDTGGIHAKLANRAARRNCAQQDRSTNGLKPTRRAKRLRATYATLGPQCAKETYVANSFGTDIIFETEDPQKAAAFYVAQLGFEVTDVKPNMISLHGNCINMFIERGP